MDKPTLGESCRTGMPFETSSEPAAPAAIIRGSTSNMCFGINSHWEVFQSQNGGFIGKLCTGNRQTIFSTEESTVCSYSVTPLQQNSFKTLSVTG